MDETTKASSDLTSDQLEELRALHEKCAADTDDQFYWGIAFELLPRLLRALDKCKAEMAGMDSLLGNAERVAMASNAENVALKTIIARLLAFDGSKGLYSASEMIRAREDAAKHVIDKDVARVQSDYFDELFSRVT